MKIDNKELMGKRNAAARAFIRKLVECEFEGNVLRASRELGLSNSVLYEVLKGTRGVGMVVLDALKAHTGQSIEAILGEAEPPDLATISTDVLAAEVERRGLRVAAAEYVQTIDQARAEGAAEEREACAKIAEDDGDAYRAAAWEIRPAEGLEYQFQMGRLCAATKIELAIRARKDGAK